MDNDLRVWKALAAACRAFADTLEAGLIAANKNPAIQKKALLVDAEDAPTETESVTSEEAPMTADAAETIPEDDPYETEIKLPEIRAFLAEKARAGFTEEVRKLLIKHGNSKLSGIDPAEYAAIMKEAEDFGS